MQVMSLADYLNTGKESSRKWRATLKDYKSKKFLEPNNEGKNCKRVVHSNKELSSYAGSLTKEFFVKVRLNEQICFS